MNKNGEGILQIRMSPVRKFAIGFVLVILFVVVTMVAGVLFFGLASRSYDPLSPAEHLVLEKYDSIFAGAHLNFAPDEWADGKVYKRRYRHGIYRVTFTGLVQIIDFGGMPEDTLQRVADALYRDLLPAIPDVDLYDSILVRYETRYRTRQPVEWLLSADSSYYRRMRTIGYGLR